MPRDILMSEETLFRDDSVFNPDHIPDQFMFRDSQLRELTYALRPAIRGGRPSNVFIMGSPATGKTTSVRLVSGEIKKETDRITMVHINCHMHSSPFKIFSELHRKVFGIAPPDSGVPISGVREKVFTKIGKEKKALVVVLDDINKLFDNDCANDVMYTILRAHESYEGMVTGIIAISTEKVLHLLDDRVRSIFSPVGIDFPRYTDNEMIRILKKRCDAGLYPSVMPDTFLEKIVRKSTDLRFAIELVKQCVIKAEADAAMGVDEIHLERALKSMAEKMEEGKSQRLLYMIKKKGPIESGDLYRLFSEETKISYTTFYRLLKKLQENGSAEIKPLNKDRGKTSMIKAL